MGILSLKKSAREIAPHGSLILGQIITASYIVLSKIILVQGISSSVFLVYQFILATIFISILAFIFERKKRPPLTRHILCWIFVLALVGVTFAQSMLAGALYFTTSAIESSVLNMIPAITYILSLISRQEKLEIHTLWGKGKIFGTLLSVSGALTLMLWHGSAANLMSTDLRNWLVGLVMVIVGVVAFSTWILMLEVVTKQYPVELSMTAIMFFFATLQTCVVAGILSHKASQWQLKWDLELLNIFIGGALNSGLANFFVAWCARLKGPVFVSSFSPLGLLFTTILESIFLGHTMHAGSVVGSVMIVMGLYIYLWSRAKEEVYQSMDGHDSLTSSLVSNNSLDHATQVESVYTV
ncbi:WAT1-related protein At4g01450-like [Magnolia sinica]|uniref:WAT1-related protein At4g01450-like n=1 Tax=Magnolia sinica TaxID=86752 RepID=UPI00265B1CA0|nr:WAT1-related protein At4g01450-like [Magnolia sinica]